MGRARLIAALAAGASVAMPAGADEGVDVLRYDLEVMVRETDLAVAATLRAAGKPPAKWSLELVPEMKVLSAESGGKAVPFAPEGRGITLDLAGVAAGAEGSFDVRIRAEGSPREQWTDPAFLRSAVRPDRAWIRSQVAWYPRAPDDPAVYGTTVDAPAGWQVRTAGAFTAPAAKGSRAVWTFETAGPVDRAGLAAGPWKCREAPGGGATAFDALHGEGNEKGADALAEGARKAFEFHSRRIAPIARKRISLVEMPAEFGPSSGYGEDGYILLGPAAFDPGGAPDWLPGGIAHEVAHAWWGGEVNFSDFASEALAEYSTLVFVRESSGEEAARRMRRTAVERVVRSAAAGKEVAFAEIPGFGERMDRDLYRVHAYEKAMMVLSMVEQAAAGDAARKALARFFEENRRKRKGWADLREALAALGPEARTVLEQWERPGIPTLRLEFETKKSAGGCTVSGKVIQEGTPKPFRMPVRVAAVCGEKRVETTVKLAGPEAPFTLKAPSEPDGVLLDPDWTLLAAREVPKAPGAPADPKKDLEDAINVANSPNQADPDVLGDAIAKLRRLLGSGAVSGGEEAVCHTGIGRCLFRLGKLDEAGKELELALRLGAGGPFHRGWVHLRLGCIADLKGRRREAVEHYEAVVRSGGASRAAVERAKRFLERPYRDYEKDG